MEFTFGSAAPPATASSVKSLPAASKSGGLPPLGKPPKTASSDTDGMGLAGTSALSKKKGAKADAPLQRPHRPHQRPVQMCSRYTKDEVLLSHEQQLTKKELVVAQAREEETAQHLETLQRLRSEVVLDYTQREHRKELTKLLAVHQKAQQDEKRGRDVLERRVVGMDHWPFRTEEQVQEAVVATNTAQKAYLDKQISEKREKLDFLQREAAKRQEKEQAQAAGVALPPCLTVDNAFNSSAASARC